MSAAELRKLSLEDLAAKSRELRDELFNVKVKHATQQLENTARLRLLRREVARVESLIREKRGAEQ